MTSASNKTYPHDQALLALWVLITDGLPSCKKFEEHNTKSINIDLVIYLPIHEIFRGQVPASTDFNRVNNFFSLLPFKKIYPSKILHKKILNTLQIFFPLLFFVYEHWCHLLEIRCEKFTIEDTNPKVPATSLHVMCDDEDADAHVASPKSDSWSNK